MYTVCCLEVVSQSSSILGAGVKVTAQQFTEGLAEQKGPVVVGLVVQLASC